MNDNTRMENNNQVFKISREQYGDNLVSYKGMELIAFNKEDMGSSLSFEWGDNSVGAEALAYAILNKIGSRDIAIRYAKSYMQDIISKIYKDEWILEGIVVVRWINLHTNFSIDELAFEKGDVSYQYKERRTVDRRKEERRIQREKDFKEESQRRLKIYEGKRNPEDRRKEDRRIQREEKFKIESQKKLKVYENTKIKEMSEKHHEELNKYKKHIVKQNANIEVYKKALLKYSKFIESKELEFLYEKFCKDTNI